MNGNGRYDQSGFTLIELSVATAVFAMGLGSFSLLLLLAVQGTVESQHQSVAVNHADSMAQRVMMNSDAVGHYVFPMETAPHDCSPDHECTTTEMASGMIADWQRRVKAELPGGRGVVCRDASPNDGDSDDPACSGSGYPVVKVLWAEPPQANGDSPESRRVVSRLPLP